MVLTCDVVRVFEWYREKLGFSGNIWPVDPPGYATLRRDEVCMKFTHYPTLEEPGWVPEGSTEELRKKWCGTTLSLRVRGVSEFHEEVMSRGVSCRRLEDCDGETLGLSVTDPDGNRAEIREA